MENFLSTSDDDLLSAQIAEATGDTYLFAGSCRDAVQHYEKSAAYFERAERFGKTAKLYHQVGTLLYEEQELQAAEDNLRAALKFADYVSDGFVMYESNIALAELIEDKSPHEDISV